MPRRPLSGFGHLRMSTDGARRHIRQTNAMKDPSMRQLDRAFLSLATGTLIALATGCASPTPYQPLSSASRTSGGYSDQLLAEDRYRVTFAGNTLTSRERVESYLLFRAAELTLQRGYDWFLVIDHEMDHEIEREIRPDPSYRPWFGYEGWRPYWRYRTLEERFEATAEIKLGRGGRPDADSQYLDAREVQAEIGPGIEYPHD